MGDRNSHDDLIDPIRFTSSARVTTYFCVNSAGERRDVTASFVEDLFTNVAGTSGGIASFITGSLASVGLSLGGVALLIVGIIMATRGSRKPRQVVVGIQGMQNNSPIGSFPNQPYINTQNDPNYRTANDPNYAKQDANSVMVFVRD